MFLHRSLILAILRLPFSALRCQRELSKKQFALEAAAKGAYFFELNSLWHQSTENGNQRIARIKDLWGISFYVFLFTYCNHASSRSQYFFLDLYVFS